MRTRAADLSRPAEIAAAVREADAVVGALPGRLGFAMLEAVIAAGKPIADISFSPEDLLSLDAFARERGVTAVVDCGVSPGISNLAVGRAAAALDEVDEVTILVGGLPADPRRPFGYAIVFSATDVIEEYTRPARVVERRPRRHARGALGSGDRRVPGSRDARGLPDGRPAHAPLDGPRAVHEGEDDAPSRPRGRDARLARLRVLRHPGR